MLASGFYNMDCMEGMAQFPDKYFDLAIVDPPYGIGETGERSSVPHKTEKWLNGKPKIYKISAWDKEPPSVKYFEELLRVSKNQIVWGANHFISKIPLDSSGWVFWDKLNGTTDFSDGELAYTSFQCALRRFTYLWSGFRKQEPETRIHPTQKPVKLYEWLLMNYAKPGDKILDTHVGSASSLIACHNMGFEYWGFELDEDYYKEASERLNAVKAQMKLW
jgi:site-specific DNA-methyltransferase (adenine-specific)